MSAKPIVFYKEATMVELGGRAWVRPINHPSDRVVNLQTARTGTIIRHDEATGEFETKRTIYKKEPASV